MLAGVTPRIRDSWALLQSRARRKQSGRRQAPKAPCTACVLQQTTTGTRTTGHCTRQRTTAS